MGNTDITQKAFIYAEILQDSRMAAPRTLVTRDVERKYGLEVGALGDGNFIEVRVLALLYTLVVYPKEFMRLESHTLENLGLDEIVSKDGIELIDWGTNEKITKDAYGAIHSIRNAVSHARIDFDDRHVVLTDKSGFCIGFTYEAMGWFLSSVGAYLANLSRRAT